MSNVSRWPMKSSVICYFAQVGSARSDGSNPITNRGLEAGLEESQRYLCRDCAPAEDERSEHQARVREANIHAGSAAHHRPAAEQPYQGDRRTKLLLAAGRAVPATLSRSTGGEFLREPLRWPRRAPRIRKRHALSKLERRHPAAHATAGDRVHRAAQSGCGLAARRAVRYKLAYRDAAVGSGDVQEDAEEGGTEGVLRAGRLRAAEARARPLDRRREAVAAKAPGGFSRTEYAKELNHAKRRMDNEADRVGSAHGNGSGRRVRMRSGQHLRVQ